MWQPPLLLRTLEASLRDLRDPSPSVRASAVRDLGQHLEKDRFHVIAGLRQMLEDPHHEPRAATAEVLGKLKLEECTEALSHLLEDPHALPAQMAIDALAEIGTPSALQYIHKVRNDPRPELRFQAILVLPKHMTDTEADQALSAAIQEEDDHIRYIALRVAEERWQGCDGAPRTHRAALAALQDQEEGIRVAAALLLAFWRDQAGASVLLDTVGGKLRARELQDEIAAVEMVGALELRDAIPALERRAYSVKRLLSEQCSFSAKVSLARLGHERARADILRGLQAWSQVRREEAVVAAGKARLEAARTHLEALWKRPDRADPTLVRDALEALEKQG